MLIAVPKSLLITINRPVRYKYSFELTVKTTNEVAILWQILHDHLFSMRKLTTISEVKLRTIKLIKKNTSFILTKYFWYRSLTKMILTPKILWNYQRTANLWLFIFKKFLMNALLLWMELRMTITAATGLFHIPYLRCHSFKILEVVIKWQNIYE